MKKKKQSKKKRGNGKQIAMVVIVIFLIAAIVGALLWLSDLGSNWDVRTWGDKFTQQEQVTKPGNSGSNKPVIPEPVIYDAIEVGDEIKAMYIDTDYVITDEDIARFKSEGKAVEEYGIMYYYLIYEKYREYFPFGLCYTEINKSIIVAQIGGEELSSEDISDDFAVHALTFSYEGGGGFIWAEKVGYISDDLFNSLFGEPIQIGWSATEYVCSPRSINVQEVRCADILRRFVSIEDINKDVHIATVSNTFSAFSDNPQSIEAERFSKLLALMRDPIDFTSDFMSYIRVTNNINSETTQRGFRVIYCGGNHPALPIVTTNLYVLKSVNPFNTLEEDYVVESISLFRDGKEAISLDGLFLHDVIEFALVQDIGLTDKFNKDVDYEVRYNLVEKSKVLPLPDEPVKEGHTFIGWYSDAELTQPYYNGFIFEDTTLYAKFEINKYVVIFDSAGGSDISRRKVEWNTSIHLSTPIRTGYNFLGWFLPDGTEYTNQPVKSDITLTAHWEVKMCTVTFYVDNEIYATKTVVYGTVLSNVIETANELNLCVKSIRFSDKAFDNVEFATMIVDDDIELISDKFTGVDKVISIVKADKWKIVGGVACGIVLLCFIAVICGGVRHKSR